jgi:hypothetical protein
MQWELPDVLKDIPWKAINEKFKNREWLLYE